MPHSSPEGTFIFAHRQFGLKIFCYILTGIQMIFDIATHKTCNRKLFSSSLPYIRLQCCYSCAAGLQPHPGSRGCCNSCVLLHFVFSALSPLRVTHVQIPFIFSCYEFSALHSKIKTGKKKSLTIMKLCECNLGKISDLTLCVCLWPLQRKQGSLSFEYIEA